MLQGDGAQAAIVVAIITTVGTVAASVIAAWQAIKAKRLELVSTEQQRALEKSQKAADEMRVAVSLPGEVPREFAAEAAQAATVRVFRRNYLVKLSFRERDANTLEMTVDLSFTLVNHTGVDFPYVHQVQLVPDQPEDVTRILRVAAVGSDLSAEYDESTENSVPPQLEFMRVVQVRPNGTDPRNVFESKFRRLTRTHDSEVLFFNYATLGAEVRIERPADLEISVAFSHREGEKMEVLPRGASQPSRWRLDRAFLAWQSLYVQWNKKGPLPPQAEKGP